MHVVRSESGNIVQPFMLRTVHSPDCISVYLLSSVSIFGTPWDLVMLGMENTSPVPDLEILLKVNLSFQVRLTIILAFGIFS